MARTFILPFGVSPLVNDALMRSYMCFHRSIGEGKWWEWSASLGGGGGGGAGAGCGGGAAADDGNGDIWLSIKTLWARMTCICCYR